MVRDLNFTPVFSTSHFKWRYQQVFTRTLCSLRLALVRWWKNITLTINLLNRDNLLNEIDDRIKTVTIWLLDLKAICTREIMQVFCCYEKLAPKKCDGAIYWKITKLLKTEEYHSFSIRFAVYFDLFSCHFSEVHYLSFNLYKDFFFIIAQSVNLKILLLNKEFLCISTPFYCFRY